MIPTMYSLLRRMLQDFESGYSVPSAIQNTAPARIPIDRFAGNSYADIAGIVSWFGTNGVKEHPACHR